MTISRVMTVIAVSDLEKAKQWYEVFFGSPVSAEPMAGLAEWHVAGTVVQIVTDTKRAGGSLVTFSVPDARAALYELSSRGGPTVELDDVRSDKVLFATPEDPDGNFLTLAEARPGVEF